MPRTDERWRWILLPADLAGAPAQRLLAVFAADRIGIHEKAGSNHDAGSQRYIAFDVGRQLNRLF